MKVLGCAVIIGCFQVGGAKDCGCPDDGGEMGLWNDENFWEEFDCVKLFDHFISFKLDCSNVSVRSLGWTFCFGGATVGEIGDDWCPNLCCVSCCFIIL